MLDGCIGAEKKRRGRRMGAFLGNPQPQLAASRPDDMSFHHFMTVLAGCV
jgi:hypothetical protein